MEQYPPASPLTSGRPSTADPYRTRPDRERNGRNADGGPTDNDPPLPKRRRWIWFVLLAVFALAFYLILKHKPVAANNAAQARHRQQGPVTLNAAAAHSGQIAIKLLAIGTVTPTYTASITSQVTGQIVSVHYGEGQSVRKGDPLIDINPAPYLATLHTAEGTLHRDQGVLAQARIDLDRYQAAWARNAIAKQLLDDQTKLVEQDEGLVAADQGTVEADQVNVGFCHIVAPISGRVGLRLVDPGNIVQANGTAALVVLAEVQPITVVFTIPQDQIPAVQRAMGKGPLTVYAYDRAQQHLLSTGRLMTTDNQIDTTTGTLKLRARFANQPFTLFPNQFVNTELLVDTLRDQVLVPNAAIQRNGQQAYVYLLRNGAAAITNINIITTDQVNSAVTGIHAGDMVATSSFEKLQDKSKVRVVQQHIGPSDSDEGSSAP